MYHIKLVKGRSYTGNGIRATNTKPDVYLDDENAAQKAVGSGYFVFVEAPAVNTPSSTSAATGAKIVETPSVIKKLNKTQLEERAVKLGIDISAARNNDERAGMVIAALEKAKVIDTGGAIPAGTQSGGNSGGMDDSEDDPVSQFVGGGNDREGSGGVPV